MPKIGNGAKAVKLYAYPAGGSVAGPTSSDSGGRFFLCRAPGLEGVPAGFCEQLKDYFRMQADLPARRTQSQLRLGTQPAQVASNWL